MVEHRGIRVNAISSYFSLLAFFKRLHEAKSIELVLGEDGGGEVQGEGGGREGVSGSGVAVEGEEAGEIGRRGDGKGVGGGEVEGLLGGGGGGEDEAEGVAEGRRVGGEAAGGAEEREARRRAGDWGGVERAETVGTEGGGDLRGVEEEGGIDEDHLTGLYGAGGDEAPAAAGDHGGFYRRRQRHRETLLMLMMGFCLEEEGFWVKRGIRVSGRGTASNFQEFSKVKRQKPIRPEPTISGRPYDWAFLNFCWFQCSN